MLDHVFLDAVGKFGLNQKTAVTAVLTMAVEHREEVLVVRLAHVRSQNEVVLVLLVGIVDAEAFASRVGKPGDDVRG